MNYNAPDGHSPLGNIPPDERPRSRQAVNLEYFFTERKDDLKDLVQSRELSVFFENKALGMSMAYGLRASLLGLARKIEDVLNHKRFYDNPIYTPSAFLGRIRKSARRYPSNR